VTLKPGLGSAKVIGTDTDRSAAYDFLLTFIYSNHGLISYRFREKRRYQSKIANFSHPLYFAPPLKGFPVEFGIGATGQKTTRLYRAENIFNIFSRLDTTTNVNTW